MTILIVSDQPGPAESLAQELAAADAGRDVLTATSAEDMAEAASSLDNLDVLLFSAAFYSGEGKVLRDRLRSVFPHIQTALFTDDAGLIIRSAPCLCLMESLPALSRLLV